MVNLRTALERIYGDDPQEFNRQINRFRQLEKSFRHYFGPAREGIQWFSTPGRTEIGGNHTDHNHGRVLAAAVNLDSVAAVEPVESHTVTIYSEGYDRPFVVDLNRLEKQPAEEGNTAALIRGIAARLQTLNYRIGGFNAVIGSTVLPGSGLSSSASVEVLIATIFNYLFNKGTIEPSFIARIGQYAENVYFGKPCGLMDQIACSVGGIIAIDFNDPADPQVEKIAFDFTEQNYRLLVVNTGGSHDDLTAEYAAIPEEMKAVARFFNKASCREIQPEEIFGNIKELRQAVGDRAVLRAMHFLSENERVAAQVQALKQGEFSRFLALVNASGNSSFKWLQNVYSPGDVRDQGLTLALALSENYIEGLGEGACRVHGGGFAGTIQAFLPLEAVTGYKRIIEPVFGEGSVKVLQIRPYGSICLDDFVEK